MAVVTGTSVRGIQSTAGFQVLTVPQYELKFTGTPQGLPQRVGFGYLFAVQAVTPFQRILLDRRAVYSPGTFVLFPSNYGFTNFRYTLFVDWNFAGLNWTVTFI